MATALSPRVWMSAPLLMVTLPEAAGATGAADGAVDGDVRGGRPTDKAAGTAATATDGLDEGGGIVATGEDGAVLDVEVDGTAVAACTTGGTDADVDATLPP